MDDRRGAGVQKVQPFQNLTTPVLQHFQVDLLESLQVTSQTEQTRSQCHSINQ